ncbi:hypothetical protein PAMC26510_27140 [Caballeronia sordidicola]|uniref:Uncharacterized protein n=1 Tax=Caballeronia sordidicola TaxID=196367 RepID=A0A242MDD3_CABSO|nr:hypothetical protein PAMC26510_27140 [Caballeronia sordidicola]
MAKVRRLERQHLVAFVEARFDLAQWCAGLRGDHEFGRVMFDDSAVRACIDDFALQRLAVPVLRTAAANPQGRVARCRGAHALGPARDNVFLVHGVLRVDAGRLLAKWLVFDAPDQCIGACW